MRGNGKVIVKRSSQLLHGLVKIKVIFDNKTIDERKIIKVYRDESEEIILSCGKHRVYAKLGTWYSEVIEIIVKENEPVYLDVGINLTGFYQTVMMFYYSIFKRKTYLFLYESLMYK